MQRGYGKELKGNRVVRFLGSELSVRRIMVARLFEREYVIKAVIDYSYAIYHCVVNLICSVAIDACVNKPNDADHIAP